MSDSVFIGIDVSSQTLEVASSSQAKTWQVANDAAGIEQLVDQASALTPALVVLEATGGYEFEAACALQAAGLAVAVVNPRTARDFARAMGALAKTDALDARMLAAFARVLHQHPERERFVKPLADAELQQLQALVLRRRQLVQMLTAERQRLRLAHAAARPSIERVIEFLKQELGDSEAEVATHVQEHHSQLAQALASVPGIGAASVAVLLMTKAPSAKAVCPSHGFCCVCSAPWYTLPGHCCSVSVYGWLCSAGMATVDLALMCSCASRYGLGVADTNNVAPWLLARKCMTSRNIRLMPGMSNSS